MLDNLVCLERVCICLSLICFVMKFIYLYVGVPGVRRKRSGPE